MDELVIQTWPIDRLIPYARNPRKNDAVIDQMAASIREFGFRIPIVAKSSGEVVDGHLRLKAARKLGLSEAPVALADNLSPAQVKAFRLLANRSANWAEWDPELLKIELEDITDAGEVDVDLIGFTAEELEVLAPTDSGIAGADADNVPEVPDENSARVQAGEVWILGKHRLICGDCTKEETLRALMRDDSADMVFTDPPYNVDYSSKNEFLNRRDEGKRVQTPIMNDSFSSDSEISENVWKPAFTNMRKYAASHCSIYVTMPQGGAHMMMMTMMCAASWQVKHELVWLKNNIVLGRADYNYRHEPILFGWADKHIFYGMGKFKSSVWEIPKPHKSELHPTMKPVELVEEALLNSSRAGDIILDCFGGSGTTLIACEKTGRRARLCELSRCYCDVVIQRWQDFTGKTACRESDGEEFGARRNG